MSEMDETGGGTHESGAGPAPPRQDMSARLSGRNGREDQVNGLPEQGDAWQCAVRDLAALSSSSGALASDGAAALPVLSAALQGAAERVTALRLLGFLDTDLTLALVDKVVPVALSHRDALLVCHVLGRLAFDDAARAVPRAVWRQLDETPGDDAYRRLAELLSYLGLTEALQQLCERALDSDDPAVREVAGDFTC